METALETAVELVDVIAPLLDLEFASMDMADIMGKLVEVVVRLLDAELAATELAGAELADIVRNLVDVVVVVRLLDLELVAIDVVWAELVEIVWTELVEIARAQFGLDSDLADVVVLGVVVLESGLADSIGSAITLFK